MKWTELVTYLKFPLQCSCGETADNAERAFEHYKKGHILYRCPECGGKLAHPKVQGEYGVKDTSKYTCYKCWLEFDAKQIRTGLSR